MFSLVSVLIALLLVRGYLTQNFGRCDYNKYLTPGQKDTFRNPNHPNFYLSGRPCRWTVNSDRPIKLVCSTFELPASPNCLYDAITVKDSSSTEAIHRYCGQGSFVFVSETNELIIELENPAYSNGGKFSCTVETVSTDNCNCGWTNSVRIAGGVVTGVNEFPMMAALVDTQLYVIFCGATIINTKQVLTAAHCIKKQTTNGFAVVVGEHDVTTGAETKATVVHRVHSFRTHSEYNDKTMDNDIALVTIVGTIFFSQQVGPVCLPFKGLPNSIVGSYVTILGWGHSETSSPLSDKLQKTAVGVITNTECRPWYSDLTKKQICTWTADRDSCQFDSGGPVLWRNRLTGRIVEVGIISLGSACASEVPAANTRVTAYMNWIIANTPEGVMNCGLE